MVDSLTKRWIRGIPDERAVAAGYFFDEARGQFVVDWMHKYLVLYEGECAGQPFECVDWQHDGTMRLFGWVRYDERLGRTIRRFRKASIWVAKKCKKSPTLAAWANYMLAGDGEAGQKVFIAAKDGQQVRENVSLHIFEMIRQSPLLSGECRLNMNRMSVEHIPTRSFLLPLSSSNSRTQKAKEGLNGSVFIDETHVVDREFVGRISRAGISRSEPLHVEVSTAGDDPDSYGKERFDYGMKLEAGQVEDHQTLFICHAAPQDLTDAQLADDPIRYGKMANPSWGHTIQKDEYLTDYNQSKQSIHELARFKMYRLNIWQRAANPWIRMDDWARCQQQFTEDNLLGQPCGAGLDLSKTEDMTALSLVFPDQDHDNEEEDTPCRVLTYYWLPEGAVDRHRHQVGYAKWAADGWLRVIPNSDVIVYSHVERDIGELLKRFDVRCLAYDQKYAADLIQRLLENHELDEEWEYKFPQTIMGFAGPSAQFERMIIAGTLHHNNNPITAWQVGHVQVAHDANDNIRPVKPEHQDIKKIDGVVATVMGLDAANRMVGPSAYEDHTMMYAGEV